MRSRFSEIKFQHKIHSGENCPVPHCGMKITILTPLTSSHVNVLIADTLELKKIFDKIEGLLAGPEVHDLPSVSEFETKFVWNNELRFNFKFIFKLISRARRILTDIGKHLTSAMRDPTRYSSQIDEDMEDLDRVIKSLAFKFDEGMLYYRDELLEFLPNSAFLYFRLRAWDVCKFARARRPSI